MLSASPGIKRISKPSYSCPTYMVNEAIETCWQRLARFRYRAFRLASCGLFLTNLVGQDSPPGMDSAIVERAFPVFRQAPLAGPVGPLLLRHQPQPIILPHLDTNLVNEMRSRLGPSWLGPSRSLPVEANAAIGSDVAPRLPGRWEQTDEGLFVWRTTIRSIGASAMRLHFEGFNVDGKVYAYPRRASVGTPFAGPYEGLGPQGDSDFWSDIVFGDSVTIEFILRHNAEPPDGIPFRVNEIAHILPSTFRSPGKRSNWSPVVPGILTPRSIAGCHLDISCYPDWQDPEYPSVALLITSKSDGSYSCSGTLINPRYDSDETLLMLTAAHCIGDNEDAQNTEFIWNYQTGECYGQPSLYNLDRTSGARLVVAKGPDRYNDFALLSLDRQQVLRKTGVTKTGWEPASIQDGTEVVNVSHPDGAFKRIAFGETTHVNWSGLDSIGFGSVRWRRGSTERGSSGSAIFRESDGRLIGVMGGGSIRIPPCDSDYRAYFNRFDRIYDAIKDYLESESFLHPRATKISVVLGQSGESITLVQSSGGGYTLNDSPFQSGDIVTARNGNKYRLTRDDGNWSATFIAEATTVNLISGVDVVTLMRAEDRSYRLDDQRIVSGSVIAHHDRGTYKLSLGPGRIWLSEPILAPAQGAGHGFSIHTVAGSGSYGFRGDQGTAVAARLANPSGVAVSDSGEVYVSDTENHRVRKITPSGVITTVAGRGIAGFRGDRGAATSARLWNPQGLALDGAGRLYVADSTNHRIRVIDSNGTITTLAGSGRPGFGGDDGPSTEAMLLRPSDVAVDALGNVYIADTGNHRIRRVSNGIITTVAGNSRVGFGGDGGPADLATLNNPEGVAVDMYGSVYIADTRNHMVRRVDLDGTISTIMGTGSRGYTGDGDPATSASLNLPSGVAVDWRGGVYVADSGNHVVRRIKTSGYAETVAGTGLAGSVGDGGPSNQARLNSPAGLWIDLRSEVYVADSRNRKIRRLQADWDVVPAQFAPASVEVPLGDSGDVARLWKSGTEFTYSGSLFESGDFVWGSGHRRYQLTSTSTGGFKATLSPPDYAEWLESARGPAEQGDADAQSLLGALFYFGDGVEQDYGEALRWFRLAAAQGDAYSQSSLGNMYRRGLAVDVDFAQAADWYRKAAAGGRRWAQYSLARLLESGEGVTTNPIAARRLYLLAANKDLDSAQVSLGFWHFAEVSSPEDHREAAMWFRLAAAQRAAWGEFGLGLLYYQGSGVLQNYSGAASWFRRAADQGLASAQSWLGSMYEFGRGVRIDVAESARWYRSAAVQGNAFSQWQLGQAYLSGSGVTRNLVTAHVWLSIAVQNGEKSANDELAVVRQRMSQSQLRAADDLKARCSSTGYADCP